MADNEKISDTIERYMDVQRFTAAGNDNREMEARNQLQELKVKLEPFSVAVEELTIQTYR